MSHDLRCDWITNKYVLSAVTQNTQISESKTCAHQTLQLFCSGYLAIITIPVDLGLFMSSASVELTESQS